MRDRDRLVIDLELTLQRPEVRADQRQLEALLDDDFVEIGASGRVWGREELIAELVASPELTDVVVGEMHARVVAPGIVRVRYTTSGGEARVHRTSWWRGSGDDWRCFFHQATPSRVE